MLATKQRTVVLLDADPDLGAGLTAEEREVVRRLLVVPLHDIPAGDNDLSGLVEEPALGALVLDGLVTTTVQLGDRIGAHLVGPGDVLHPPEAPDALVPARTLHRISDAAQIAVLDRRFIAALRRWPALLLTLQERQRQAERRLLVHAAIGKLRRVEDRVLALLWHLAERWGRVTPEGVVLPLSLTHAAIGQLAGAERPTVSLALKALTAEGELERRDDGSVTLRHRSPALARLSPSAERPAPRPLQVRRTRPPQAPRTTSIDVAALHRRVAALREELPGRTQAVDALLAGSRLAAERSAARRLAMAEARRPSGR